MKRLKLFFKISTQTFCQKNTQINLLSELFFTQEKKNKKSLPKLEYPTPSPLFQNLEDIDLKKLNIFEIRNFLKKNENIENLRKQCINNIQKYLNLLSVIYKEKEFIENFTVKFHIMILNKILSQMNLKEICELYYYIKIGKFEKSLYQNVHLKITEIIKKDFTFENNKFLFFALSCFDHEKFLLFVNLFEFDNFEVDSVIIWNGKNFFDKNAIDILFNKFILNDPTSYQAYQEIEIFINYIETFLILKNLHQKFGLIVKHKEQFEKLNEFVFSKISNILEFSNNLDITKTFKILAQYAELIFENSNTNLINKIQNIKIEKFSETNFQNFIFLINHSLFIYKTQNFFERIFEERKEELFFYLKKHLENCDVQDYKERLGKKHFFSIVVFLYQKNYSLFQNQNQIPKEKQNFVIEIFLLKIIEKKYKLIISKNELNQNISFKIFYLLKYLIEENETAKNEDVEFLLKYMKNLEFSIAFHAKFWNYNESDKKDFKSFLAFFNNRKIGSRKMKQIIYMALDNVKKLEREKIYQDYLKIKSAKIDLKKRIETSKNN